MTPILKWAGGKRQLINALKEHMPQKYKLYVEPFFGSGALFFEVAPPIAVINDNNRELINFYERIKNNILGFRRLASRYQNAFNKLDKDDERAKYYYRIREIFNERIQLKSLSITDAALLLFLNKTCYNGLYRVNAKGHFNTPYSKCEKIKLFDIENLNLCAKLLNNATITLGDFEEACKDLQEGDFVYFDSPYYDTFNTYQAGGFPESDHLRLVELFKKLSNKNVLCMLSNSDTPFIKELYKKYNIDVVPVKRMINCDGENRTGTELIITNY